MKDLFITQEMNDNEIKTAVKLFEKAMKKSGLFKYTHANPLTDNCYISSCGCIIGVYFPNTQFECLNHSHYEVCALVKHNNELGVCYSLKDDFNPSDKVRVYFDDYIFASFDELIYTREEREIKKAVERRIKEYNKNLKTLESIKRVYKKNGEPFARLLDNFTGANISLSYSLMGGEVASVKINYDEIYIYRKDENREKPLTAEELESLINEYKQRFINYLATEKNNLKTLESNFKKFKKITDQLKDFLSQTANKYDYKKQLEYMIL